MEFQAGQINAENPVFQTCVLAACIMVLKLMLQPWLTVWRMMKVKGGFRSPENIKKSPSTLNQIPSSLTSMSMSTARGV